MNEVTFNVNDLDDETIQRMLIALTYIPPSERIMKGLVEVFSVRPHKKSNPGLDPDSEEFINTLPEMPKLVTRVFDILGRRAVKVNRKWTKASLATGKNPPNRYRRG